MRGLLQFIYQYRVYELFIILELFCAWLIINNNRYHNVAFLNASNNVAANVNSFTDNSERYFELDKVNEELATENAILKEQLAKYAYSETYNKQFNDSLLQRYFVSPAKVIKNTVINANNYFTIDKGSRHGIRPGMGVASTRGAAGQVKYVSSNFSTVTSMLHADLMVSSVIKRNGAFCTTQWDGTRLNYSKLKFVPRHLELNIGDTILTSGYNSVFPEGMMIGVISEIDLQENESFFDITIELATDFSSLSYVYIAADKMKEEIDSLTNVTVEND